MSQTLARVAVLPAPDRALATLLAPALDVLFQRPEGEAALWGHAPFIHWLLHAMHPRRVAAAGRHGTAAAALRAAAARLDPPAIWAEQPDASTDLLLLEATDATKAVLAAWLPHLTLRAALLLHGPGGAAMRAALGADRPHFTFPHADGLVLVALGDAVAEPVAALCRLAPDAAAACRERFALLGAAWQSAGTEADLLLLRQELASMRASTSWRITAPLRLATRRLRRPPAAPVPPPRPVPAARPNSGAAPHALFLAAEPDTPGALYRCARPAAAASAVGWHATWRALDRTSASQAGRADVVVLWRGAWGERVEAIAAAARRAGARVVLDLDDLVCAPDLVRPEVIDGMRSAGVGEAAARAYALRLRRTMLEADALFASTAPLAAHLRAAAPGRPVFVLPNGFDAAAHARSRRAARARRLAPPDGTLRLGYAAGTPTHQRDFAIAAPAVARLLRARPEARLVLFLRRDGRPILDPSAFPALAGCEGQIEWRRAVPLTELPDELARFDINLAPLEVGNPFCEAKSELKYFEAALVDVPTIASPTAPLAAAIEDGVSGLLAPDADAWEAALFRLADDPVLRQRLAAAAYRDVLVRFGPEMRADAVAAALDAVWAG
jgi:glycosyltransferase involved in cell wall biosynthesis